MVAAAAVAAVVLALALVLTLVLVLVLALALVLVLVLVDGRHRNGQPVPGRPLRHRQPRAERCMACTTAVQVQAQG